ncbi:MAG: hypothetical protein ACR2K2_11455 [Mycobacteriales bacterium]
MRRTKLLALGLLLALLAACGGHDTKTGAGTNSAGGPTPSASGNCAGAGGGHFTKTKFVLHAGIAFGAFHRYIYKPYRAGAFKSGAPGRTAALAKAGASALVVAHEVKAARDAAKDDPTLCRYVGSLDGLSSIATSLAPGLTGGSFDPTKLLDLNKRIDDLKSSSSSGGTTIPER